MPNKYGAATGSDNQNSLLQLMAAIGAQKRQFQNQQDLQQSGKQQDLQNALTEEGNKQRLNDQGATSRIASLEDLISRHPGMGGSVGQDAATLTFKPTNTILQGTKEHNQEGKLVHDNALKSYKPVGDMASASKDTLTYLDQGNANADKLALINEARASAGQGGSRAIAALVQQLAGKQTMISSAQDAMNWLNNTQSIPTLQPDQRDAIRESVFSRAQTLAQMHDKATAQLKSTAPSYASGLSNEGSLEPLIDSYGNDVKSNISDIGKMAADYADRKQKGGNKQVGQPGDTQSQPVSTGDKIRSTLAGWLTPKPPTPPAPPSGPTGKPLGPQSMAPQQSAPTPQAQDPIAAEMQRRGLSQ